MKLVLVLLLACLSWAQTPADRKPNATLNPCPGGIASAQIDTISFPSLDRLVLMSNLIVVGTVVNVLPSFAMDPKHVQIPETDSQISVTQTIFGKAPSGMILLFQLGGQGVPCSMVVKDDPLVKSGEQYILFLHLDDRKVPNTSGIPRYEALGVWSGKVPIIDGKVYFPLPSHVALHKYDGMDLAAFVATLHDMIVTLSTVKR